MTRTKATRPQWWRDERGEIGPVMILYVVIILAAAGLVFDGGRLLAAKRDAANRAEAAARAAAATLSPNAGLDPDTARTAAYQYLTAVGIPAADASITVAGDEVTVTVTEHRPQVFFALAGVTNAAVTSTGRARTQQGP